MIKSGLFCLFVFTISSLHAQFIIQNSGTQQSLEDVRFVDSQTGIVVGDSGTVLRTLDGGDNWTSISGIATSNLSRVGFFDAQNAMAIGNNPANILITHDTGQTWTNTLDSNSFYYDIAILNDSVALISTSEALLRTQDRGQTWSIHYDGPAIDRLGLMSFVDEQTGFSIRGWAGFGPAFSIHKTTDGGSNWTEIPMLSGQNPTVLEALVYLNDSVGFSAGWYNPHLAKTTNAGADWTFCATDDLQNGGQIIDMTMINDTLGFATGWYSMIFKTVDGGANWYMLDQVISDQRSFKGLYFIDDQTGWVVGNQGTILKTSAGGGSVNIEDEINAVGLSIFPNPSQGIFEVQIEPGVSVNAIEIFDVDARLVERLDSLPERLELRDAGIYLVVFYTDQGLVSQKVWVR